MRAQEALPCVLGTDVHVVFLVHSEEWGAGMAPLRYIWASTGGDCWCQDDPWMLLPPSDPDGLSWVSLHHKASFRSSSCDSFCTCYSSLQVSFIYLRSPIIYWFLHAVNCIIISLRSGALAEALLYPTPPTVPRAWWTSPRPSVNTGWLMDWQVMSRAKSEQTEMTYPGACSLSVFWKKGT